MKLQIGTASDAARVMKRIFVNCFLVVIAAVAAYFTAIFFGKIYYFFVRYYGGLFSFPQDASEYLAGLFLAFSFFLPLMFTIFGGKYKYWWTGILLLPVFILFFQADFFHIYFPIILGLVGWAIGYGLSLLWPKRAGKQN